MAQQYFPYAAYIGGGTTLTATSNTPSTVYDTADGSDDGTVAIGQTVDLSLYGAPYGAVQILGTTPNGVVVYIFGAPYNLLLSSVSYAFGAAISVNTTDPYTFCFLSGTMIATPSGEVPVEYLKIGDLVTTADGRAVPVKWLGEQRVKNWMFTSHKKAPVCISAGALGDGLPHTDLYVTADHGMIVDDLVVNASALVNNDTIRFVPMAEMGPEFTYYHVETEAHDEILANGAPAETFIDYVGRKEFDNHQEYVDLYGCERIIPEMKRTRISAQRQLPAHLCERFGITGYSDQLDSELDKLDAHLASKTGETDWNALLNDPATKIVAKRNVA